MCRAMSCARRQGVHPGTNISKARTLPAGVQLPVSPAQPSCLGCQQGLTEAGVLPNHFCPVTHGVPGGGVSHRCKGCDAYVVTSKEILEFEKGAASLELEGRSRGSFPRAPVGWAVLRA